MKNHVFFIALIILLCGCKDHKVPVAQHLGIHNDVLLKTTPVKNQGHSDVCWIYAMLATIESEHLMKGDSVNLSPAFYARMMLRDKAYKLFFNNRNCSISMRGMGMTFIHLINKYGAEPYDSYPDKDDINYKVVARKIEKMALCYTRLSKGLRTYQENVENVLDEDMGYMPAEFVHMLGAQYTPLEFAHSVCVPDEYLFFTSFTHHPFGKMFAVESPDNVMNDSCYNVDMKTMMTTIENVLRKGHPVFWEGDISEPGFSFADGIAVLPSSCSITQENRQRMFENHQTTDDHAMALVGLAHDKKGRKYFIAKNSWGTGNSLHGFMYLSYEYVAMKTICFGLSRQR